MSARDKAVTSPISVVTDSTAMLPDWLVDRLGVTTVPVVVELDGRTYHEGVDLEIDDFYRRMREGSPELTTSQPSPGTFIETYETLAAAGAEAILSIHVGSEYSGTVNSATLAASEVAIPVEIIDTGVASFGVAACVWEAVDALDGGADLAAAVTVATRISSALGSTFVLQARELVARSGRIRNIDLEGEGIAVLALDGPAMSVLGHVSGLDEAVALMASHTLAQGSGLRVAIGLADPMNTAYSEGLEAALGGHPEILDLVHYRIGASVAAHIGPDTAGLFFWRPDSPRY